MDSFETICQCVPNDRDCSCCVLAPSSVDRWFQHHRVRKNWRVVLCSYIFVLFGMALVCTGIVLEAVQVVEVIRGLVLVVMGIVVIVPSCECKGGRSYVQRVELVEGKELEWCTLAKWGAESEEE